MDSKHDSHMRIDKDRLQIDDLIIIPNNLHAPGAAGTEETGSALQNLAKIASRYQNHGIQQGGLPGLPPPHLVPGGTSPGLSGMSNKLSKQSPSDLHGTDVDLSARRRSGSSDNQSLAMAKKPRMDYSNLALSGTNLSETDAKLISSNLTSSQLQQSLLNMFPPNLLAGLPPSLLSTSSGLLSAQTQQKGNDESNTSINKQMLGTHASSSGNTPSPGASKVDLKDDPKSKVKSQANANNCMQLLAACSMAGVPPMPLPSDAISKLGPEGLNLLQMYEKHLRQLASSMTGAAPGTSALKNGSTPLSTRGEGISSIDSMLSTKKEHSNQNSQLHKNVPMSHSGGSPSSAGTHSTLNNVKDKVRSKVCKPPPDTKRPPSLMQTPCAFKQTTSIYTNPLAELTKAREAVAAHSSSSRTKAATHELPAIGSYNFPLNKNSTGASNTMAPLDLTSTPMKNKVNIRSPPPLTSPKPGNAMGLNLKKESSLLKPGAIGSSGQENASTSAKNQQAVDLAAILQLDPTKLDPTTAALHLQLTQQLAANPQLLNVSNPSYLSLASLGGPQSSSSSAATRGASAAVKNETKPSPFSAEALLSKPSPSKLHGVTNPSSYSDLQSAVKPNMNSFAGKSLYSTNLENLAGDRRLSNSSPTSNHSNASKLAAAQANAAAIAFGLPLGATSTQLPRQSPSSSGLASATSTSHSPSSSNAERGNRNTVSPWHPNLASNPRTTITPSPKHSNPSPAPSSKNMPPLTTNPNAAATALLEKLGLDKLGVDPQTLLKDPVFKSALVNLGMPPNLLAAATSSSHSIPPSTSLAYPTSSLSITPNHSIAPSISGLSQTHSPSTTSSPYGGLSTTWSLSNPAMSLSSSGQGQSLLSNPYLALMSSSAGAAPPHIAAGSAASLTKSAPPNYGTAASLMDPATSAYYAALYSQQMYGAAGLNPYSGLPTGGVPRPPVTSHSLSGLDHLQAATLQSMMGGIRPPSSSYGGSGAAATSAAAMAQAMAAAMNPAASANPFGAYAGLGGLSGFPGLGGFPSGRKDP